MSNNNVEINGGIVSPDGDLGNANERMVVVVPGAQQLESETGRPSTAMDQMDEPHLDPLEENAPPPPKRLRNGEAVVVQASLSQP